MGLFTPNAEELKKAANGGREEIPFKDGEKARLMIKEFKEMPDKDLELFSFTVVGGEHDGKDWTMFIRGTNDYKKGCGLRLMKEFFSDEEILNGRASVVDMIGGMVDSVASVKPKPDGSGNWPADFAYFKKASAAPLLQAVGNSDIPF